MVGRCKPPGRDFREILSTDGSRGVLLSPRMMLRCQKWTIHISSFPKHQKNLKSVNFPKSYSQSKFAAKQKIGLWGPRFIAVYQPTPKDTTKATVLALDQQCRKFCDTLFYITFSTPEFVIQYGTLVYNC